jgi:hypothetical protein
MERTLPAFRVAARLSARGFPLGQGSESGREGLSFVRGWMKEAPALDAGSGG